MIVRQADWNLSQGATEIKGNIREMVDFAA